MLFALLPFFHSEQIPDIGFPPKTRVSKVMDEYKWERFPFSTVKDLNTI